MDNLLTPEEYQQLLTLGQDNALMGDELKQQLAIAEQLRQGNAPQMRNAGRATVAPHWMELLGGLAREKSSYDRMGQAQQTRKGMQGNMNAQHALMLRALGAGAQQPAPGPTAGTGFMPPGFVTPGPRLGQQPQQDDLFGLGAPKFG